MGSTTQHIDDATNLSGLGIKSALGYAMPPIVPFRNIVIAFGKSLDSRFVEFPPHVNKEAANAEADPAVAAKANEGLAGLGSTFFQCKLEFDVNGERWALPIDPLIAVNGKNVITKRYVSKSEMRGSIKESWSQDDFEVTISGILIAEDHAGLMAQIKKLRGICEKREAVSVYCDFLNNEETFNINKIAIESYDFPFTKGMENQSFSIKAYSDDGYSLLEEA